jgi:tetratricopeptide (TPR) repeat protein
MVNGTAANQSHWVPGTYQFMGRKKSRAAKIPAQAPLVSKNPAEPAFPIWLKHFLAGAALCLVTLLAYSNSFHDGLVLDSHSLILNDTRIRDASAENVGLIFEHSYFWPTSEVGLYRPATTLSYLFNYAVLGNGETPAGYHWINYILHSLNVLLLYALALRLLRKFWPAVFIAALWAVHPVLTESVTNIIGRSDLLAGIAVLGGLLLYLKSVEATGWRLYAWLCALMAVTTVGVFSKESAVAILGVIVLYEIAFWSGRERLRGLTLGCAAVAIPIVVMLIQRARVLAASPPAQFSFVDNPLQGASFFKARMTALAVGAKYLWLLVWPAKLSADYSYSQIPIVSGTFHDWIAWLAVVAVFVAVAMQLRANRLYFFFGMFTFLTFAPVANILFFTGTIMAERFLYLPAVGFAACVVMMLYAVGERTRVQMLAPIALGVIVIALGIRTWERNVDWKDDVTLASASVQTSPDSFKSHWGLALALAEADPAHANIAQVIEQSDQSLAILGSLPDALNISTVYATAGGNYRIKGDVLAQRSPEGRTVATPESMRAYEKSFEILTRGAAIDRVNDVIYRARKRARGIPADQIAAAGVPLVYSNLAATELKLGKFQEAYETAVYARKLDPDIVDSYMQMAQALAPQNRKEEAAQALVEGVLVSGSQNLLPPLAVLYKYGVDPEGCGIKQTAGGALLNNQCATVHKEICEGSAELIRLYKQALRPEAAATMRSKAVEQFGCAADELEKP